MNLHMELSLIYIFIKVLSWVLFHVEFSGMSAILALYKEFSKWNLIHLLRLTEWNFKVKSDMMIAKLCSAFTHGQQCTEGYWRLTDLWSLYMTSWSCINTAQFGWCPSITQACTNIFICPIEDHSLFFMNARESGLLSWAPQSSTFCLCWAPFCGTMYYHSSKPGAVRTNNLPYFSWPKCFLSNIDFLVYKFGGTIRSYSTCCMRDFSRGDIVFICTHSAKMGTDNRTKYACHWNPSSWTNVF